MRPKSIFVQLYDGETYLCLTLIAESVRNAENYCRDNYGAYDIIQLIVSQTDVIGVDYSIDYK